MRQKTSFAVFSVFWLLCLSIMARGQTIVSSLPDTICVGATGTYAVAPPVTGATYAWTITPPYGNISGSSTGSSILVLWGMPGTAIVTVTIDSAGVITVLHDTVVVEPLPQPYITADKVVGCQLVDSAGPNHEGRPGGAHIDDDNGCIKVCEGSIVTYTGHGPAGSTYGWIVSGGTILTAGADTCVVLWGAAGGGSITVIDTSAYGCIGTKTVCIDIIDKPHAFFYAVPNASLTAINVCLGATVVFKDSSWAGGGSAIISSFWDFGDGTTLPSTSPTTITHTFSTVGIDTVTLIVKNACGCTDTFRMVVTVDPNQGVKIVCPHLVCEFDNSNYCLDPVPPCGTYNWTALGGTITVNNDTCITVNWNNVDSTGFGYVIFDATPCSIPCATQTVVKVPVILSHGTIFGPKIVCDESQYIYSMPRWPTTVFNWTITGTTGASLWNNDQNNEIVLNTHGPGIVYLECNYHNTLLGCDGVAYDTIIVTPLDSILGADKLCLYTAGTYSVSGPAMLIGNWTLTDPGGTIIAMGGPSHTFTTPTLTTVGTYVLNVVSAGAIPFCPPPAFLIKVVGLPPSPDSIIGPDTACFGSPVRYKAKNDLAGYIFEWAAITGTCNFSSGEHTDATFSGGSPADIMVWRVGTDAPHCHSDTIHKMVYRPYVALNLPAVDTVCPSSTTSYSTTYIAGETYDWTVINTLYGSVVTNGSPNVSITWNNFPGALAQVILKVRRCDTFYFDTINVYIRNVVAPTIIAPATVCRGETFTASLSPSVPGTITWSWGDGATTGTGTYSYTFLSGTTTTFTITATIVNPYGCVMTLTPTTSISVRPAPVAYVSPGGPLVFCGPFSTTLCANLTAGYEPTDSLIWVDGTSHYDSCGTGLPCSCQTITTVGDYWVIAVGANGCRASSNVVHIDTSCGHGTPCTLVPDGWAHIDSAIVECGVVHLHGIYAGFPLVPFSFSWNAPPHSVGVVTTNNTLDCTMDQAGMFTFSYTVGFADNMGDTCYITCDTTILVPIIAGMMHSVDCIGGTYHVTMIDHSDYYPTMAPHHYNWYIDNVLQPPLHNPSNTITVPITPGPHWLGEWVFYGPGMSDSCYVADSIYLDPYPVADFSWYRDTTCAIQASVAFTNLSTPTGLSSLWDFNDGSTNSLYSVDKVYSTPGIKHVTLTVTNSVGCVSSVTKDVVIAPQTLDGYLSGDSVVCSGSPAVLIYNLTTSLNTYPEQYYWMNDLDTVLVNTANTINVFNSGSYWVHGTNHYGCYVNTERFNVNVIETPPAIITGDVDQCLNTQYTLNGWAGDDPSLTYQWFKNGVAVGTTETITDPAASPGTDTFQLVVCGTVMGVTCCDTSALFIVTVHSLPPSPYILSTMLDCSTYSVQFTASGTPAYGWYNWSNGMTGQTIVAIGGGPYRVWYTDTFGCVSHGDLYFPKDPRAYMWIFPTGCFELCDTAIGTAYIVGPIIPFSYWAYQYWPVGPIIMDTWTTFSSYVLPFYPPGAGSYDLVLDNGYCRDTSDVLDLTLVHCGKVDTLDCKCLTTDLSYYTTDCHPPSPGCCNYFVKFCIKNDCPKDINVTVSISGGTFVPSSFVVSPGFGCTDVQFIPSGVFTGGWQYISITWFDADGNVHKCNDSIYIKPCAPVVKDCKCIEDHKYAAFIRPCVPAMPGCCEWYLSLCLNNTCDMWIHANVTITGGTLTPSTVSSLWGPQCDTFHFTPSGPFAGGWQTVTLTWMDAGGIIHVCQDKVYFPPCKGGASDPADPTDPGTPIGPGTVDPGTGTIDPGTVIDPGTIAQHPVKGEGKGKGNPEQITVSDPELSLIPNPAKNTTRIDYTVSDGNTGTIQVFDMMGRLIDSHECTKKGSWVLKLDNYSSGVYVVALKQNNMIVRQARLSIVR